MKKRIPLIILIIILISLTACGGNAASSDGPAAGEPKSDETSVGESSENPNTFPGQNNTGDLPIQLQLVLGTIKLENTDLAVTTGQAGELLPLWKAARSLSSSDSFAQEELDALFVQIQETMTPEQLESINRMELTRADFGALAEELGLEVGSFGSFENLTPEQQSTLEAARESGEPPPGGFGGGRGFGGGQGPGGEQGPGALSPEERATAIAERGGGRGAGLRGNVMFYEAIITFLEGKL